VAVRGLRDMEDKENRALFRVCIYPIAAPGSMDRSEREKGTKENIAGCQMQPCRASGGPRGTS
jgi:hypothetical protein